MVEFVSSRKVGEWRETPRQALPVRSAPVASVAIGMGSEVPQEIKCKRSVCSVGVERNVASKLRPVASGLRIVASASGAVAPSPRSLVADQLQRSRRAAAANKFERMWQRLAQSTGVQQSESGTVMSRLSDLRRVGVRSVGSSELRQRQSVGVASRIGARAQGNLTSLRPDNPQSRAPVGAVACVESVASVGEWRSVGDASSSVLSRVKRLVEASAELQSMKPQRAN